MSRYTVPAGTGWMYLPYELAPKVEMLLSAAAAGNPRFMARNPEVGEWLAELVAFVPARSQPFEVETTWISTEQAAPMLGVQPRQMRNLKHLVRWRSEDGGRVLLWDRADVIAAAAARGNPLEDEVA